jgi:hypothetical protein
MKQGLRLWDTSGDAVNKGSSSECPAGLRQDLLGYNLCNFTSSKQMMRAVLDAFTGEYHTLSSCFSTNSNSNRMRMSYVVFFTVMSAARTL